MARQRRIWRCAWNLAALLSLLVLVLVFIAWLSSHDLVPLTFAVSYETGGIPGTAIDIVNREGWMHITRIRYPTGMTGGQVNRRIDWPFLYWETMKVPNDVVTVRMAHWVLAIPPTLVIAWWVVNRSRNRIVPGHCRQCGYNLTGTLAAGRTECPECGSNAESLCPIETRGSRS